MIPNRKIKIWNSSSDVNDVPNNSKFKSMSDLNLPRFVVAHGSV